MSFNGKLVFRGKLNEECSRYLKKKRIIEGIIKFNVMFVVSIPFVLCFAFAVSYWVFLFLIVTFIFALIDVLFYDESFKVEPDEIDIDDMFLTGYCAKYDYKRMNYLSDVLEVTDMGAWYKFKYNLTINVFTVCQKDLIVEGTLEEFEELFADKLVRKETKE